MVPVLYQDLLAQVEGPLVMLWQGEARQSP